MLSKHRSIKPTIKFVFSSVSTDDKLVSSRAQRLKDELAEFSAKVEEMKTNNRVTITDPFVLINYVQGERSSCTLTSKPSLLEPGYSSSLIATFTGYKSTLSYVQRPKDEFAEFNAKLEESKTNSCDTHPSISIKYVRRERSPYTDVNAILGGA